MRDFTYIDDIIDGIVLAIHHGAPFDIFNLGRGEPLPIEEMIDEISEFIGKVPNIKRKTMSMADVPYTSCNISHSRDTIGYSPHISLRKGIRSFVRWYIAYMKRSTAGLNKMKDLQPFAEKIKVYSETDIVF